MANLKEIRGRIQTVKTTQQMTRAMKMVAAAKLRRAQDNIIKLRPYANKLREIMSHISESGGDGIESPYLEIRTPEKVMLVIVTSNRGLCGAFNANVCKMGLQVIKENYEEQRAAGNLSLLCIGKKGFEFFTRRGYKMYGTKNHDVFADLSFDTVSDVAELAMKMFAEGELDRVDLVYNEFKNVVVQNRKHEQFLPLISERVEGAEAEPTGINSDYIFEPNQKEILEELIPRSLKIQFYKSILESNAGEQGARMSAMDSATENAEDLLKALKLTYNRARQAAITTEILEIVGGAEALAASS